MTPVLLVMRKGYRIHGDHLETMRRLGLAIHLVTEVAAARGDGRFAEVVVLEGDDRRRAAALALDHCAARGIAVAVTFQETDIEVCAEINAALGAATTPVDAARTSRDKALQRRFLVRHELPTPRFQEVASERAAADAARAFGYPVIIKPTRAASSTQVALVVGEQAVRQRFRDIAALAASGRGNYYEGDAGAIALIEEFLPGDEVTLDGVVVDGELRLGGIHNKLRMPGPFFEEDLYSLPFKHPELVGELAGVAARICRGLGLRNSLFNVELRQDAAGVFRVVEFSPRISGGHVYRNIRDVHLIDLVAAHLASCVPGLAAALPLALRRTAPRLSTCIKFVYRDGWVVENHAGRASLSDAFVAYYPLARAGDLVRSAPRGFDIAGLLSVRGPYRGEADLAAVERRAIELSGELGLVVTDEAS